MKKTMIVIINVGELHQAECLNLNKIVQESTQSNQSNQYLISGRLDSFF